MFPPSPATWLRRQNEFPGTGQKAPQSISMRNAGDLSRRVSGHSVLGSDLDARADAWAVPLVTLVEYVVDRALRPTPGECDQRGVLSWVAVNLSWSGMSSAVRRGTQGALAPSLDTPVIIWFRDHHDWGL
jgi:hypothetical protein